MEKTLFIFILHVDMNKNIKRLNAWCKWAYFTRIKRWFLTKIGNIYAIMTILHADINKLHVNIVSSHVDIIYFGVSVWAKYHKRDIRVKTIFNQSINQSKWEQNIYHHKITIYTYKKKSQENSFINQKPL